ncbi:hypothetical protein [Parabacteroides sp. PF5-9]|uniref:hypothetical protein n=1 Tax=Parabacteroides sp. PF5-9 TaxID=1742404 RepID=UPI002475D92E|nr:hypothetical protein [Parabacteroides sp. PF5-9]MDH6356901.1 hypothetical protein [Parabacteroides sp. PF5-9]
MEGYPGKNQNDMQPSLMFMHLLWYKALEEPMITHLDKFPMKVFRLAVLSFVLIGFTSCDKERMHISSGRGEIDGEKYKYQSTILSQIMAPDPYEAYLYKAGDLFVFQTGDIIFTPANKRSDSPNFLISLALSGTQEFVVGGKYTITGNGKTGKDYRSGCYVNRYWWVDGISCNEWHRYGVGYIEFTRVDKENGWVECLFEFEIPATDLYDRWIAKGNFKLYTEILL